jgi:hypothetical protein
MVVNYQRVPWLERLIITMCPILQTNRHVLRFGGVREISLPLPTITSVILTILVLMVSPMSIAATFVKVS